jgi:hypothetical protein
VPKALSNFWTPMLTAEGVKSRFFAAFEMLWQAATSAKITMFLSSRMIRPFA